MTLYFLSHSYFELNIKHFLVPLMKGQLLCWDEVFPNIYPCKVKNRATHWNVSEN